jgi:hypothetical protein
MDLKDSDPTSPGDWLFMLDILITLDTKELPSASP